MDAETTDRPAPLARAAADIPPADQAPDRVLVNPIPLTADDIAGFRDKGYIRLRGLLTPDCTEALRAQALETVVAARDIGATYGDTFRRLTYALGETAIFKAVYTARAFRKTLGTLTGTRLIMTEAQGFELNSERNGFPWHYGSLSFRFIRPQDMGYSIWIPLDPIDPAGQGGGMAYIPETLFSARGNFQMSSLLSARLIAGEPIEDISAALFKVYDENSILMTELFEAHKDEDAFDVGDAFLFNKNVWHRSSPLKPGPMASRLAVNMRFIDWRARLDKVMFEGEAATGGGVGMGANWGVQKQTTYGAQFVDIDHGDEIRDSRYCGMII
ncbi:hypothetical protein P7L78_03300 (plasmid) [Tistrella bauzanensis]|uniref:phytanoyl-CoA dioxygenase family protein n=1 Tax=Tistrella TaxID=171436 RepID=UPI0031F70DEA